MVFLRCERRKGVTMNDIEKINMIPALGVLLNQNTLNDDVKKIVEEKLKKILNLL